MARRRLDLELVNRGLAPSRSAAQAAIADGRVEVRGLPTAKASTLVEEHDVVRLVEPARFVGRGGEKLQAALDRSGIEVGGRSALDVGASTGGFTDCLLQNGAASVVALDVGYGQLHWRLQSDPRVLVIDRTNIRHADPAALGAPFGIVVGDLSFISVRTVAPALRSMGDAGTDYVVLVKPQFEVGREQVGRGGIVRSPVLHREAVEAVVSGLGDAGIGIRGGVASPVTGAKGNREFLVWGRVGDRELSAPDIDEMVQA